MQLRKIETAAEKSKRERNRSIAIGLVLVVIMVLSTAGYAVRQEKEETIKYNGFSFVKQEGGWQLQKPFSLLTAYNPKEVEAIQYNSKIQRSDLENKDVYFTAFDSEERIAANEIFKNLPVSRAQKVCLEEDANKTGCEELPLKNCYDNTIIVIKDIKDENVTVTPRAYQQARCIFIESDSYNITKVADRLLFSLYGIM